MTDLTVYDTVGGVDQVPGAAQYFLWYIDGAYRTEPEIKQRFPTATGLAVTVNGDDPAVICDVENGDATPAGAAAWRRDGGGQGVYSSASRYAEIAQAMGSMSWWWWCADWTGKPHIDPRALATQWGSPVNGTSPGNYDISTAVSSLFGLNPTPPPGPTPAPPTTEDDMKMTCHDPVTGGIWATDINGDLYAGYGAPMIPNGGLNSHPDWNAGGAESWGTNPCVGIEYWGRPGGSDGIVYFTRPASGPGGWAGTPYSTYRFLRNGQPD